MFTLNTPDVKDLAFDIPYILTAEACRKLSKCRNIQFVNGKTSTIISSIKKSMFVA
jgi:hypothetical protein